MSGCSCGSGARRLRQRLDTVLCGHVLTTDTNTQVLFVILVALWKPLSYANDKPYPDWAQAFGLMLSLASMVCIPGYAIYYMIRAEGSSIYEVASVTCQITVRKRIAETAKRLRTLRRTAVQIRQGDEDDEADRRANGRLDMCTEECTSRSSTFSRARTLSTIKTS